MATEVRPDPDRIGMKTSLNLKASSHHQFRV
jgi:hypothetical protein